MNDTPEPRPSVGILLTTYNGQAFLREQLESLLAQIGASVHVYAFDDSSTDDTVSILRAYASDHPGSFTIYENSRNSGGTGLNILRSIPVLPGDHDYVALADQDDVWLPQKLQSAIQDLSREQADFYFSNLLAWDGKDTVLSVVNKAYGLQERDHLFGGGSAGCTYVMSRRFFTRLQEVLARTDLGDVRRISHDWIIYFLARHYGHKVHASHDALIKYRIHSSNVYGATSLGGFSAKRRKLHMLGAGFMRQQIENSLRFAREGTVDRDILMGCTKGRWRRLVILLKYRFSLVRSRQRFLPLAVALLLFD